jgi:hypothetical protein
MPDKHKLQIGDLCIAETKNIGPNVLYIVTDVIHIKSEFHEWEKLVLDPVFEFSLNDHPKRRLKIVLAHHCQRVPLTRLLEEYAKFGHFIRNETRRLSGDDAQNSVQQKTGRD